MCSTTAASSSRTTRTSASACRWEAAIGSELPLDQPGEVVVDRRMPGDVFTYEPNLINPTYVKVHIQVPQSGERE